LTESVAQDQFQREHHERLQLEILKPAVERVSAERERKRF
jgi:hypothetical protein